MKKISVVFSFNKFLLFLMSTKIGLLTFSSSSLAPQSKSDEKYEAEDYCLLDTFSSGLIDVINDFHTYSQDPIMFNDHELLMLTSSLPELNVEKKEKVLWKFHKKIQEIKCTNAAIAQTLLQHSKDIINVSVNSNSEPVTKKKMIFFKLKNYLARMLSVLYLAKTVAPKWLWVLYFRVYGVVVLSDANYLLDNNELNAQISKYTELCLEHKYLDEYYVDINGLAVYIRSVNDVYFLMDTLFTPHDHEFFKHSYRHQNDLTISNLYLQPFWDKHELLFGQILGVHIDWTATINLLDAANTLMKNHVASGVWVKQPFRVKIYLEFTVNVIKVRLYVHTWIHLTAYRRISATCSKEHSAKLMYGFYLLLKSAAKMVCYKDDFMEELIEFLNYYALEEIDGNELTTMSVRIMKTAGLILNDFNINQWPPEDNFDDIPAVDLLGKNSAALQKYIENIQKTMQHTDVALISYLLNADQPNEEILFK